MLKKCVFLCCTVALLFTGCSNSRQIETASVIENISVEEQNGQLMYTFYPLTDSETPQVVAVPANSLQEAQALAERQYIPNLSLSKLELLLLHTSAIDEALQKDIEYISTQASFSPSAYVAVCDTKALKTIKENSAAQSTVERQLILCKNQNPSVNISYLAVFNRYARSGSKEILLPYITAEDALKVSTVKIDSKTEKNEK